MDIENKSFILSEKLRNPSVFICLLLILSPIVLYFIFISFFGVNVAYLDEFENVKNLEKIFNGNLTFIDLFAQHNEHRIFFPNIIYLPLAYLSHFNTLFIMYCSAILVSLNLILLFLLFKQMFGSSSSSVLKFIPVAWLMFILSQWENTLWGFQICVYLCVFGFLLSLYALQKSCTIDKWFILAIICGVISIFSFFNGFLVPIIGFIIILTKKERIKMGIIWIVFFSAISAIYFYGWIKPSIVNTFYVLYNPLEGAEFFLINIGSPLGFDISSAFIMGVFILVSILTFSVLLLNDDSFRNNIIIFSLILFSLGTSSSITIGRSAWTLDQALMSRYISFTLMGVIGLYLLTITLLSKRTSTDKIIKYCCILVLTGIFIGISFGDYNGIYHGEKIRSDRSLMAYDLKNYNSTPDAKLKNMYPVPSLLKQRAQFLEKMKYNVFAE